MTLDLSVSRPKLTTTNSFDVDLTVGTATYDDTNRVIFIPINAATVDPPSFTVASCTTTSGSPTVTTATANGFQYVKVGDPVTGTGIPGSTTVAAKGSNTSITLSANATASGTVTLTFDPASVTTPVFAAIGVSYTISGTTLTPSFTYYTFDGTVPAGGVNDASSTVTLNPSRSAASDVDAYYTNLRVFRTV